MRQEVSMPRIWRAPRRERAGASDKMEIGRVQAFDPNIVQRHHILQIMSNDDVRADLLHMALQRTDIGKHRLIKLNRVDARREIIDRIRPEIAAEEERVGTGTSIKSIVRTPNQFRLGVAGGKSLIAQVPVQYRSRRGYLPIAVQVMMETRLDRRHRGIISGECASIRGEVAAAVRRPDNVLVGRAIIQRNLVA